ncbi:MAG: hypothetical protein WBE26_00520 [Phycisphaerae bacterium]
MNLTADSPHDAVKLSRRRTPVSRSVIILVVGTVALFVFILVQGDLRRRQRAMEQAHLHAAALAKRVGEAGALPLNLELLPTPERKAKTYRVEQLSRQDARHLRKSGKRVIVAQTVPLPQVLTPDGRAVIFFEGGKFDVEWLTLPEFDELYAAQQDEIRRLAADTGDDLPGA